MAEYLVVVDVETTGLNPVDGHHLLEIAARIVHAEAPFAEVGQAFHAVVKHDPESVRSRADEYVQNMHDENGLWNQVADGFSLAQVDTNLLEYLQTSMQRLEGRFAGNSVRLDMNFIDAYLPKSAAFMHYRSLDVTGLSFWANRNFGVELFEKVPGNHRAARDVLNCLAELRYVTEAMEAAR